MSSIHQDDAFYCFGDLEHFEAQKILPRLEEENIRFEIELDSNSVAKVSPADVPYGLGGASLKVRLFIHREDESKFRKVSSEFFKI